MSGLYFKYGTMNSSKTANLLMAKHNYEEQGFDVILLKPDTDTRSIKVTSRVGLSSDCIGISSDAAVKEIIDDDPDAKVIMVTAAGQKANMIEALKMGAADFIQKPFEMDVIVNTVE